MPANLGATGLSQMWLVETWSTKARVLPTALGPSFISSGVSTVSCDNNRSSSACLKGQNGHYQRPLRGNVLTCEAARQEMLESGKIFRDRWSSTHIFSSFSTVLCCWPCLRQDSGLAGPLGQPSVDTKVVLLH